MKSRARTVEGRKTATRKKKAAKKALRRPEPQVPKVEPAAPAEELDIADRFRNWAEGVLSPAGPVARFAKSLNEARPRKGAEPDALQKAGEVLRSIRQAVGMSAKAAAQAAKLRDPRLVEHAEGGKVALPLDAIVRLATVLGQKDPTGVAIKLLRAYDPHAWKSLDKLRMGGFIMPNARERAMLEVYRKSKAAQDLSEADFGAVLESTKVVFEALVKLRAGTQEG